MGTLAMIGYKMKLYSSMTKLQADIAWYNYMIKLKKRQFGIEVYKVRLSTCQRKQRVVGFSSSRNAHGTNSGVKS
jgi:hypothetical protein